MRLPPVPPVPPVSPRAIMAAIIVALAILAMALLCVLRPGPTALDRTRQVIGALDQLAQQMVDDGKLARHDGYVYAVDVGQLMTYAALSGNQPCLDPTSRGLPQWRTNSCAGQAYFCNLNKIPKPLQLQAKHRPLATFASLLCAKTRRGSL